MHHNVRGRKFKISYPLFFFITFIIVLTSCSGQEKFASRNKASVRIKFDQWQQGKGSLFDLLHSKVIWRVAGTCSYCDLYHGKDDFLNRDVIPITAMLGEPIKPELVNITAVGDLVWLNWKGEVKTKGGYTYKNHHAWMLKMKQDSIIEGTAFLDTYELNQLTKMNQKKTIEETKEYIGMWVTEDGYIRHELLPNNRYDEARGNRESAYQGSYRVTGNHIDYKDDTGFLADGEFRDCILYHAGMVLYKKHN